MTRTVKDRSPLRRDFLRLLVLPARQVPVFSRIDNLYLDEPERNEHKKRRSVAFTARTRRFPSCMDEGGASFALLCAVRPILIMTRRECYCDSPDAIPSSLSFVPVNREPELLRLGCAETELTVCGRADMLQGRFVAYLRAECSVDPFDLLVPGFKLSDFRGEPIDCEDVINVENYGPPDAEQQEYDVER